LARAPAYIAASLMDAARINRARVRAWRRGFREADLIFGPFADLHGSHLTDEEMDCFEALLDQPDLDVVDWILEGQPTPADFETPLMQRLRLFIRNLKTPG
jgi:antitoxin CptB